MRNLTDCATSDFAWRRYSIRQPIKLDDLWAGICLMGAVYFIFRSHW